MNANECKWRELVIDSIKEFQANDERVKGTEFANMTEHEFNNMPTELLKYVWDNILDFATNNWKRIEV